MIASLGGGIPQAYENRKWSEHGRALNHISSISCMSDLTMPTNEFSPPPCILPVVGLTH